MIPDVIAHRLPPALLAGLSLRPATAAEIRARSSGEVTQPVWAVGDPAQRRGGLFDASIFGPAYADPQPELVRERVDGNVDTFVARVSTQFGHLELAAAVSHPISGASIEALAVLPPTLRPIIYLAGARYSASHLNDLYQRVIEVNARARRLVAMDPDGAARHTRDLATAIEQLLVNAGPDPICTPRGRAVTSLADHLRIAGRSAAEALLFALGYEATWGVMPDGCS